MTRKEYKTDLSDAQWQVIKSLIPPAKTGGRRRTVDIKSSSALVVELLSYITDE
ncbi:MAG: hypothetical protein KME57_04620 [Scytonema hyalinum WJT4-NPBG1]|nr:hypothetical protein [Scytonema hyalinum WJT4-NPBG1]